MFDFGSSSRSGMDSMQVGDPNAAAKALKRKQMFQEGAEGFQAGMNMNNNDPAMMEALRMMRGNFNVMGGGY